MIYEKSAAGYEEIANSRRVLSFKHRQVLIMVDGKRTEDELKNHLNNPDVAEIMADLMRLGYIQSPGSAPPSASPPASANLTRPAAAAQPQSEEIPISSEQLQTIKEIMISSSHECLGIIGRGLVQKIEAVQSRDELKAWISQWHMAIRESRLGKPLAGVLMEQVQQTLAA
ncbi:MAG TPA: hypothetical protein VFF74_08615 [Methylophilaceae bacterium]|nr:hypothetical protein [Methylophilaceae bacterium]